MHEMKPYLHTYCVYLLGKSGISQASLASAIGCTPQAINLILQGKSRSKNIQKHIARILGHRSWSELDQAAQSLSLIYDQISQRQIRGRELSAELAL